MSGNDDRDRPADVGEPVSEPNGDATVDPAAAWSGSGTDGGHQGSVPVDGATNVPTDGPAHVPTGQEQAAPPPSADPADTASTGRPGHSPTNQSSPFSPEQPGDPPPGRSLSGGPPGQPDGAPVGGSPRAVLPTVPPTGYGAGPGYRSPPNYGLPGPSAAGTAWISPGEERTYGLLAHLGALVVGIIAPLIVFVIKGDASPYVRQHAVEALNFQLTMMLGGLACVPLMFILIGIPLLIALGVVALIFTIQAAIAANRGAAYRYPVALRMVK